MVVEVVEEKPIALRRIVPVSQFPPEDQENLTTRPFTLSQIWLRDRELRKLNKENAELRDWTLRLQAFINQRL